MRRPRTVFTEAYIHLRQRSSLQAFLACRFNNDRLEAYPTYRSVGANDSAAAIAQSFNLYGIRLQWRLRVRISRIDRLYFVVVPFRFFPLWNPVMRCFGKILVLVCFVLVGCEKPPSVDTTTPVADNASENVINTSENVPVETTTANQETIVSNYKDSVLRHAVFFKFKDDASEDDVQRVAEAFAALPKEIPQIIDFQWGTNNSPEKLDDGFTHCFLLTFADEKGREVYLPHPAHKAFGDTLRPHMEDVFVIDYWGKAGDSKIDQELKHAVFFKFKDDAPAEDIKKVEDAFAALPGKIDQIKAFEWGKNNSPEKHDDGFTHCFMVTFDSDEGRQVYLPHADHKAFVEVLKPVLDKVRVLDFTETK